MSYSGISVEQANRVFSTRGNVEDLTDLISEVTLTKGGADFNEEIARDVINQLNDLVCSFLGSKQWAKCDSKCAPLVHQSLSLTPAIAGDPDFWRWLTFSYNCFGAEIIDARYGDQKEIRVNSANNKYYGLTTMKEGMFAKLWICANVMYDPESDSPYDGIEYADADLWDSHIVAIDFGSVPQMARAFIKFVRDDKIPRGKKDQTGFRDLAKELRRRYATIAFEVLSEAEARDFIAGVWADRASWCGGPKS